MRKVKNQFVYLLNVGCEKPIQKKIDSIAEIYVMKNELTNSDNNYHGLLSHISEIYVQGREKATIAVNTNLLDTYWRIGKYIVEFEQKGNERAKYGTALLKKLSKDLKLKHGKGFSLSNIKRMRQFYIAFPKGAEAPHLLSWTHYVEILKISDDLETI